MKEDQPHPDEPGGEKKTGDHDCCGHGDAAGHDHHHRAESGPAEPHHHDEHGHGEPAAPRARPGEWTCPMHPEVISDQPGDCPKCGMALEQVPVLTGATIYTCPMHPEIEQAQPGDCPICGMPLESKGGSAEDEHAAREIRDLSRKFWIGLVLTVPVLVLAMGGMIPALRLHEIVPMGVSKWIEFALATPVILWAGSMFCWRPLPLHRHPPQPHDRWRGHELFQPLGHHQRPPPAADETVNRSSNESVPVMTRPPTPTGRRATACM